MNLEGSLAHTQTLNGNGKHKVIMENEGMNGLGHGSNEAVKDDNNCNFIK